MFFSVLNHELETYKGGLKISLWQRQFFCVDFSLTHSPMLKYLLSHLTGRPNLCVEWEAGVAPKSRDITWSLGGCQGDVGVFIFQVVRRVIMVYDRDRRGNLRPAQ